jgi:acyl dehydratase
MNAEDVRRRFPDFDTSDVDRWIGVPLGGGVMKEPVSATDVRRWAQGMQNPNPLYYDEGYAAESRFGRLVAPQSFVVCTSDSHGAGPAIQGTIPGTHMLFGGDEWWFFGPRIEPGDRINLERMLFDYKVTETKFAGPTMFSRGDTTYVNQRGELVAKQRSTSIRYLAEEARRRGAFTDTAEPAWDEEKLLAVEREKFEYYRTFLDLGHDRRLIVKEGEKLPRRPIGPHTIQSFTTEWRAFLMTAWGTFAQDGGPSSLIGMPRGYGYGASMGAWTLDTLGNWAGEWADVVHSRMSYRSPALTGDVTYLDGDVSRVDWSDPSGRPIAHVSLAMTNQKGEVMATGTAEVRMPTERLPVPDRA